MRPRRLKTVSRPVLVILGGLPATGKSTVASELNKGGAFSYVRIDALEQALRDSGEMQARGVQGAGYMVGYAVAGNLLDGGNDVLVECVNPIEVTRAAWRDVAASHGAGLLEVELFCSSGKVHRARAESRTITVPGLTPPTWEEIEAREFEPWPADLRIDSCASSPAETARQIREFVSRPHSNDDRLAE